MSGFVDLLGLSGIAAGAYLSGESSDDAATLDAFLLMLAGLFMVGSAASN